MLRFTYLICFLFSTLIAVSFAPTSVSAQAVVVQGPENRRATTIRNETGLPLQLHIFYGHDTAQVFAFHIATLNYKQSLNLDAIAGVSRDKYGGRYVINAWHKGGGFLGTDAHWKKNVKVWGDARLRGRKSAFNSVNTSQAATTIRLRNISQQKITAHIYNSGDTSRLIAAQSYTLAPGTMVNKEFFSRKKYGLTLVNAAGQDIYEGVVDAQRQVVINDATPQVLKAASFNVKLMSAVLQPDAERGLVADGHTTSYAHRLLGFGKVAESFGWQVGDVTHSGFDVLGFQEVWRHSAFGDDHFVQLRAELGKRGFAPENVLRGTGAVFERGLHHGLVIASRYPIVESAEMMFDNADHTTADFLVQKGVLFARLNVNGVSVAVFNTHLQAFKGDLRTKVRADQIKKLRAFISKHARPREAIIVMGDFNVDRVGNCDAPSEYCSWRSDRDSYGDWRGFNDNRPQDVQYGLDYIFSNKQNITLMDQVQEDWIYINNVGSLSRQNDKPASSAQMQKITDHPLIYGAFTISPRG